MSVQQLLQHVPPNARYHRGPLDDADNALGYWERAAQAMVPPGDELCGALDVRARSAGADADRVAKLLDDNREAFELLHQGARRRRIQFPELEEEGGSVDEHAESLAPLGELAQLWFLLAQSKMLAGHASGAAAELVALGQMGHILCCGEGLVMHYLVGAGIMQMALSGIHGLAAGQDSGTVSDTLAEGIQRWIAAESEVTQCLRVDLCTHSLRELDRLANCSSVEALVDELLERHYAGADLVGRETTNAGHDDGRQAWRRKGILYLLDEHPAPFDNVATARLLGRLVADRIRDLQPSRWLGVAGPWSRLGRAYRRSRFRARRQLWPAQLQVSFPVDCLGPGLAARARLDELRPHVSDRQWAAMQPPSEKELSSAHKKMKPTPNALGVLVAEALLPADISQHEQQRRQRLRVAQAAVARLRERP